MRPKAYQIDCKFAEHGGSHTTGLSFLLDKTHYLEYTNIMNNEHVTKWKCPVCGFVSGVPAIELAEVGTPHCPECEETEMEAVDDSIQITPLAFNKITTGFVNQTYERRDGRPRCIAQEFMAGDSEYENEDNEPISEQGEEYCPFNMAQPSGMIDGEVTNTEILSYSDIVASICESLDCYGEDLLIELYESIFTDRKLWYEGDSFLKSETVEQL